jgi:hypothetical protein
MKLLTAAAIAASMIAAPAFAAPIVLDFEGIPNLSAVGDYYNGGGGPNYGISFSGATLALVDSDAGGSGNFANEPSPNTIMFYSSANNAILNFAAGFTTGFSFFYTSTAAVAINVYDQVGGAGNLLGTLNLSAQASNNCGGDPTGGFCNFSSAGVTFAGTARSIDFSGGAGSTGFDDITFGSATPGVAVPEPATWAMLLLGFGATGALLRTRRRMHFA